MASSDRRSPYSAFNFVVEIDGLASAGFSDVSGLGVEVTIAEYRDGTDPVNHVRKVPGMYKVSDVTLKRGIISSEDLWGWLDVVRRSSVEAKKSISIVMLDEAREEIQRWNLHGVVPMKYTGPTLAAKGGSDVAMEELVLSAEAIELAA